MCELCDNPYVGPPQRKPPRQKPGRSEQTVWTPPEFIASVERRYGKLTMDLAATDDNHVAPEWITPEQDSLNTPWPTSGTLWLNPPFADIAPWAKKCAEHCTKLDGLILLLVPASVGSLWYHNHVHPRALVSFLRPRIKFVGHKAGYPKDLLLACYGHGWRLLTSTWDWKNDVRG